jgi:hypothetical protein
VAIGWSVLSGSADLKTALPFCRLTVSPFDPKSPHPAIKSIAVIATTAKIHFTS